MLRLNPLSDVLGIEAEGIELSRPLDDDAFTEIEDAFYRAQVLVLRGQSLTAAQFLAFARRLGRPEPHVVDRGA